MRSHSRTTPSAGRRIAVIAAVNFVGLGSLTAPAIAGLPLQIEAVTAHDDRAVALGTVLALGSVAALIANPVFGALSDRTRGRFGRRRPWMAVGAVAGFGGIAGLGTADTLPAIALWWVLVQVAYNATLAAAAALLADTVPEPRRAAASGYFTAAAIAGAFPPLILATILPSRLGLVSFVMPVLALIVVAIALTLRESPVGAPSVDAPASPTARTERGGIPRAFVAVWLQRFAMQSAFSLTAAFTMYLVIDRMTGDPVTATPVATLSTLIGGLGIVVGATVAGAWASRRGRYLPFLVAGAIGLAIAAAVRATALAPAALWVAALVGGVAVGGYLAVNFALALRVLPAGQEGAYLGVLNAAETAPGVFAPLLAAALLGVGAGDPLTGAADNYVALYGCAALVALLSLAAVPALRGASRPSPAGSPEVTASSSPRP